MNTDTLLSNIYLPKEAVMCRDGNCNNSDHKSVISSMYEDIVKMLFESCKPLQRSKSKKKVRPGWNDHVADVYTRAREASTEWILAGKLRYGPVFLT